MTRDPSNRRSRSLLLTLLLLASLTLNAIPLWWGAAPDSSWAFDELLPRQSLEPYRWPGKYPPLYRGISRAVLVPLHESGIFEAMGASRPQRLEASLLVLRGLSVLLATATVWLIYLVGRRLHGERCGLLAGAALAVSPIWVFYAKTANLEAPYLFFLAASVLFAVRWLQRRALGDALLMAVFAAASIATKDSAYAIFPLWPLVFVLAGRHDPSADPGSSGPPSRRPHVDWRLLVAFVIGLVMLALFFGLPWRAEEVREHIRLATRAMSGDYREWPNTLAGHLGLLAAGVRRWSYLLGVPLSLAALWGLFECWRQHRLRSFALLAIVSGVSYYALYIASIGFHPVRYYLPLGLLASITAGIALDRLLAVGGRVLRWAPWLVSGILILALSRAVFADLLLWTDTRLAAETWRNGQGSSTTVLAVGREALLPRGVPIVPWKRVRGAGCELLSRVEPDFVIVSPLDAWSPGERTSRDFLLDGSAGLRVVKTFDPPRWKRWYFPLTEATNLAKASPELIVLAPDGRECRDRDWLLREIETSLAAPASERSIASLEEIGRFLAEQPFPGRRTLLPERAYASGLDPDGWTYGTLPAAIGLLNPTSRIWRPVVKLRGFVATRSRPQVVHVVVAGESKTVILRERGWRRVEVPELRPGQRLLILLKSETAGRPGPRSKKRFGVRVRIVPPAADRPAVRGSRGSDHDPAR